MKKELYDQVWELSKETALMTSVCRLLEWDQETYMPQGAIEARSMQVEKLATLAHKMGTAPKFGKLLAQLETTDVPMPRKAAVREWRRDYDLAKKLPSSFVKKWAKTTSTALHVWSEAKKNDRFKLFAPHLEKIVSLARKKADYLGFKDHPYDALLDNFEPGMNVQTLTPLFETLKGFLSGMVKKIGEQAAPDTGCLHGEFPSDKQLILAHEVLKAMGFDPLTSRLDQSVHPFCTGLHPLDTRMTTHIHADQFVPCLYGVIHEGGHGLYNNGLPPEQFGSPLGEQISLGIDESQSRMWETIVGRSLPFCRFLHPKLRATFPDQFDGVSVETLYHAINHVKPSLIRIHADELTYSLHIILRFEIEKALIEGSLKVKEIPEAWNEKMGTLFGITPPSDATGCLQDIHWSMGAIGYFPTYTLGNLYAAQFFHTFQTHHPDWKDQVAHGNLLPLREWLRQQIHCHGKTYTAAELCHRVTGAPLSPQPYIDYLTQKFSTLYTL
jgi:carboxypeptidase Taq